MAVEMDVHEIKSRLDDVLARVRNGEEITIAESGEPVARLAPIRRPASKRRFGLLKGKVWIADDFDAPLPEEILREWEK